jgi:hypothetical protein
MKTILSYKITEKLKLANVLDLFHICKTSQSKVYFYTDNYVLKPQQLSKMVSFFLTFQGHLYLFIDGQDATKTVDAIDSILNKYIYGKCYRKPLANL